MLDKNGYPIEVGDAVLVPEPIDGDGECFDIESERLEIQDND